MRLVHVADYAGPYPGSFIPMVRAVIEAAWGRDWEVEAVFPDRARGRSWLGELESEGFPVRVAPTGSRRGDGAWLAHLLGERPGPTILHSHFNRYDVPAVLAARGRPETAVVWHVHGDLRPGVRMRARNTLKFGLIARRVDRVLCVAPDIAEATRRRLAPRGRVVFFPNAIDTGRFSPTAPEARIAARADLGLPDEASVLLHLGWDWGRKGGDLFLEAVRLLADDADCLVALTVGGGENASRHAERLGLEGVVRVLDPTPRVAELYAAADVFVTPSRAEGMPYAMTEALASGLPVVGSDIPGQRAIAGALAACRITPLEPERLAEGVRSLLARRADEAAEDARVARRVHGPQTLDRPADGGVRGPAHPASTHGSAKWRERIE